MRLAVGSVMSGFPCCDTLERGQYLAGGSGGNPRARPSSNSQGFPGKLAHHLGAVRPAEETRMTDLAQVDLSARADSELTPEERMELHRRFKSFTQAVKEASLMRPQPVQRPKKKILKWNPLARAR